MATRASIAARQQLAVEELAALAKEMGSHDAEKRLERARLHKGRDPATRSAFITANLLTETASLWREGLKRWNPDPTPIEEITTLSQKTITVMHEAGIKTKGDLYNTPDHELLKLRGVAPDTLHRIRDQL